MGINIDFGLFPPQMEYFDALQDNGIWNICYGGARKGGKSHVGRAGSLFRRMAYPGSMGLIMRETMDELMANHWHPLLNQAHAWGLECRPNVNDATLTFPQFKRGISPSQIYLGYGKTTDHVRRYQGHPYLDILYDEATNIPHEVISLTNGSLANEHWPETVTKNCLTCNPGGINANRIRDDYVEAATRKPHTVFIQAFVEDNPAFLASHPHFVEQLEEEYKDQPWIIEMWLRGDWYASPSSYFAFDAKPGGRHVRAVEVPYYAKWYAALDAGYYPDPFAAVWSARWRDDDGKLHLHCVRDYKGWRLELDEQAERVARVEKEIENLPPLRRFADWSTAHRIPSESAQVTMTTRKMWQKHGVKTQAAKKWGRLDGWMLLRYLLKHQELTIDPACKALINEFRDAQHQKVAGQVGSDLDDSTGDHCLDDVRIIACETIGLQHMKSKKSDWEEFRRAA